MNILEKQMIDLLTDLRENYHAISIMADFEAVGMRIEEALRLKEVTTRAGLGLTVKIGGCCARKDMYEARMIGVERLLAPMVESPFALRKFLAAVKSIFPEEEREQMSFLVNIETTDACTNFDRILAIPEIDELTGIDMGRIDLSRSLGLTSLTGEDINNPELFKIMKELLTKAKERSLECVVGGGVSKEDLPFFKKLPSGLLDCYERMVIFRCPEALGEMAEKGLLKAARFELLWLKNKRNNYGMIYRDDEAREAALESRYKRLLEEAGGE